MRGADLIFYAAHGKSKEFIPLPVKIAGPKAGISSNRPLLGGWPPFTNSGQ